MLKHTKSEWRSVHKSLLRSKKWRKTTDDARLLYYSLLLTCDSYGAFVADADDLSLECFPGLPNWTDESRVQKALNNLAKAELLIISNVDASGQKLDRTWGWITEFDEHQPQRYIDTRGRQLSPWRPLATDSPPTRHRIEVEERSRRELGTNVPLSASADDPAEAVWEHWLTVAAPLQFGKPARVQLTADRRTKIQARLNEGYTAAQLTTSIDGFCTDDHHRGKNDRRTPYLDIGTIFRNASKVDAGIAHATRNATRSIRNGASLVAPQSFPA